MQSSRYRVNDSRASQATYSRVVVAFSLLVFMLGYAMRPDSVSNGRVAIILIGDISTCTSFRQWLSLDFPSKVYAAIDYALPFDFHTIASWDVMIFLLGVISMIMIVTYFTRRWDYTIMQSLFLLGAVGLCGIYIFIFNKDVIQFFIFAAVFLVIASKLTVNFKMFILIGVFLCEFIWWRQYYAIVAAFIPIFYFLLGHVKRLDLSLTGKVCLFILLAACATFVFSFALNILSHDNYVTIVEKHGVERESYTATSAASGITSVLEVSGSSPVPMFVANWLINVFRLLFPIELFLLGPYYWIFAVYQLYLSSRILKAIAASAPTDKTVMFAAALFLSFVLASATFEPDFGSWVRHETAALPILLLLVSQNAPQAKLRERTA